MRGFRNGSGGSIFLKENAAIVCDNVTNFRIEGLTFILCSHNCKKESALESFNSGPITLSNCVFLGNGNETLSTVRSVYSEYSDVTVLNCHFEANSVRKGEAFAEWDIKSVLKHSGGAICASGGVVILEGTIFVGNLGGSNGGALHCDRCTLVLRGNNSFENNGFTNKYMSIGGAINIFLGKLIFKSGTAIFSQNEGFTGGAITLHNSEVSCDHGATVFLNGNRAEHGGGMHSVWSKVETSKCAMTFVGNFARLFGGGISMGDGTIDIGNCIVSKLSGKFINNSAMCGGAVFTKYERNITFTHADISGNSKSALCIKDSTVTFKGTRLLNNLGGGIYSSNSILSFESYNSFEGNTASSGGAMYTLQGTVLFDGVTIFAHNSAERDGGALYTVGTAITLRKMVNFTFNSARNGGAAYFKNEASMTMEINSHFNSSFNTALNYGGGIYHNDNPSPVQCNYDVNILHLEVPQCFIQFKRKDITFYIYYRPSKNVSIYSYHDFAGVDGSFLYGGLLDRCQINTRHDIIIRQTMYQILIFLTLSKEATRRKR